VNNLLTAIRLAAEAIGGRAGTDSATQGDAAQIQASAARAAELLRRVLAPVDAAPEPIATNTAVRDVAAMLAHLLGPAIHVRLDLADPSPVALAERVQLDQMLVNLAVNARDAMPQGGTLVLRTAEAAITRAQTGFPDSVPPGRYAVIEVADSGTGILPEVLPRIFDPHFTTRAGQPDSIGGSGLGLAGVYDSVRQAGGFLSVVTVPGQGTRMTLHLPRHDGPGPTCSAPAHPTAASHEAAGRCVLLVDDEDTVRHLTERALVRRGWRVLAASGAQAALAMLDTGARPQVVVTDMIMPGMDGAALVQAVRARLGQPDLPAILVSGYAAESLRAATAAAGAMFLAKPYRLAELAALLADCSGDDRPVQPAPALGDSAP
jgi:two-component system cell cycle sensor histidine kinase/response regulator CckA